MNSVTLALRERIFSVPLIRWFIAYAIFLRGWVMLAFGHRYRGADDLCWVERVSGVSHLRACARRWVVATIDAIRSRRQEYFGMSYLRSGKAERCARLYSITGVGKYDIFRDLIVLKSALPQERGIILLKYTRTFNAALALFDQDRIFKRYIFVLEPSWAGYCDPSILSYVLPGNPVFIQCFTDEDYRFIGDIGFPLVPMHLGPADWVDADGFAPRKDAEKVYDLIMVASWATNKRHRTLFEALATIKDRDLRVLLIGFPWYGRTMDDIRKEAATIVGNRIQVEFLERVPHEEIVQHLSRAKVYMFLSRKEGDNKALVEALFADVPAIVYDKSIGGARSRVNSQTGVLSSDADLAEKIRYMLDNHQSFSPREWALEHTGSYRATQLLNEQIRQTMISRGERFTVNAVEKVNSPNLEYRNLADRALFKEDYQFIVSCLRDTWVDLRRRSPIFRSDP
jgi:glycosyltransferase involved in cell wall biosynthesis